VKINVSERTPAPRGERVARGVCWLAAIAAAPFSGGLSLVVGPMMEVVMRTAARREAAEALDEACPEGRDKAGRVLHRMAAQGMKLGSVRYGSGTDGYGYVEKELTFQVED